jgi:hypothetical protein
VRRSEENCVIVDISRLGTSWRSKREAGEDGLAVPDVGEAEVGPDCDVSALCSLF